MKNRRNILVIGANSFIGRELCHFLIRNNCHVLGTSRKGATLQNPFYDHFLWDSTGEIDLVVRRKIDSIILLSTVADINNNTPLDIHEKNLMITNNVLKFIANNSVDSCIFTSSIGVYDKKLNYDIIDDSTPPTAHSAYAASKLMMEKEISKKILTHVIRLPSVLGKDAPHGFLPKVVDSLRCNSTINIYNGFSLFNHVTDTNVVNKLIFKLLDEKKQLETFNISSFPDLNIYQIITRLKNLISSKSEIVDNKSNIKSSLIYSTVWEKLQIVQPTVSQVLETYGRKL
jgi:nucleoside-diphosphate-sugar epimerase